MARIYRSAQLSYTEMFDADELIVEFDGVTYTLANKGNGKYGSGNSPNSTNPIGVMYVNGVNIMYIDLSFSNGDHHVVIKVGSSSVETTECFKKAVRSISGVILTLYLGENGNAVKGATWQEAYDMLVNGAMVYLNDEGNLYPCSLYSDQVIAFSKTVIADVVYTDTYIWNLDGTVIDDSATYPSE